VNHGTVLVAKNATCRLVDVDSFQITVGGRTHTCDVGVPTHQPPELQGSRTFEGLLRTTNHDNFGLAVLIFQLLFLARHPFAGRFLGAQEMPIERAIRELRYAYGSAAASKQMRSPPGSLAVTALSPSLAAMFERAFGEEGIRRLRPQANEWVEALSEFEQRVKQCASNSQHSYFNTLAACPICAVESSAGVLLFIPPLTGFAPTGAFDLALVWRQIESIELPKSVVPPQPGASAIPSASASLTRRRRKIRTSVAVAIVLASVVAMGALPSPIGGVSLVGAIITAIILSYDGGSQRQAIQTRVELAKTAYESLVTQWGRNVGDAEFRAKKAELTNVKTQYAKIPELRLQRLQALERRKRETQLASFLDRFEIEDAHISGVGPALKATLESYGVETAADISYGRVIAIPGFGPSKTGKLVGWQQGLVAKFRFDPTKEVDRGAVTAVERGIYELRRTLEEVLIRGAADLARIGHTATARMNVLRPKLEEAARELAQAEADFRAL